MKIGDIDSIVSIGIGGLDDREKNRNSKDNDGYLDLPESASFPS
jgi:hypothetical protein